MTFIYLEMPKFKKELKDIKTRFEKWLYIIRNLNKLDRIPDELQEGIIERLFETAEIAKFTLQEAEAYEDSLKSYRDLKNSIETALEEGMAKGRSEEQIKIAILMLQQKEPIDKIIKFTGLTKQELEKIAKKDNN